MTNNEKLKQIISNLQILTDLTNRMIDSEMYPVSFFSQAFDMIQKIQNDIHILEANQVEMFATQMKKHQALILSIHQQMRNIYPETHIQRPLRQESEIKPGSHDEHKASDPIKRTVTQAAGNLDKKDEKVKKMSLLSRFGISSKHSEIKAPAPVVVKPVPSARTESDETQKKESIELSPATKPVARPIEEPIIKPETKLIPEVTPTPLPEAEQKTLPAPEQKPKPVVLLPEPKPASAPPPQPVTEPKPEPTPAQATEPKPTPAATLVIEQKPAPPPVTEPKPMPVPEKKKLPDLRKMFSLNDRFMYRRELFGGNEDVMNKAISTLNNRESFKESISFIEENMHWDFSNTTVKNFVKTIELRFL